jgi:hypothetical protein
MKRRVVVACGLGLSLALGSATAWTAEQPAKPKIAKPCLQCHRQDEKILRGNLAGVSQKAETIQIQIGPATWLVKYDGDSLKVTGADKLNKIAKEKEVAVEIEEKNGELLAKSISVKPPAVIPAEKLIKTDEVAKFVAAGTDRSGVTIVDSRPSPRSLEAHIPGAISIYDAEFDKQLANLPKDKDRLLVFYCAGEA